MADMNRFWKQMTGLGAKLRTLLFPRRCICCTALLDAPTSVPLCSACQQKYLEARRVCCPDCRSPIAVCRCRRIGAGNVPLYSLLPYRPGRTDDPVNRLLYLCKNGGEASAEDFLAEQLAALCECVIAEHPDIARDAWILTYPPRSAEKKRQTGHDQAEALMNRLSRLTGLSGIPCFVRDPGTGAVQKMLNPDARAENARSSYRLTPAAKTLDGRYVMLIDDIATTGATLGTCASMLLDAGVVGVIALTAAQTVHAPGHDTQI